ASLGGANLRGANLRGAILDNTDITAARNWQQTIGITDNLSQKLQQQNQEIERLKTELKAAKASEQAGGQNTEEIKRLNDELKQKQNEQAQTEKQLHKLQEENERYRLELESKNKILSNQIDEAQKALAETFKDSADQQIQKHNKAAECVGQLAIFLICLDAVLIFIFLLTHWFGGKTPTSGWSLAVYSFPVLIILVLATTLLRHQKKLLDEVRHFAAVKQQIELYSGLLKASQHAAAHLNDPDKSAEYVQETFSQIRTKLLQHNFTAAPTDNKDGDTGSGVDKLTEKLLEKMADAISKSGKSTS
ncbi:pentapeptide repeat-containing protein, partial [Conchiformibius steedae]|uniref:pentapeptide repeat-containing protein n=1 Tax=Conchiformibius steedae TaxID=153493 RepID=UPI0026F2BC01